MQASKGFFIALSLALAVFCIQNIDGKICRRKNYYCPPTNYSYNYNNLGIFIPVQRKTVNDMLTSIRLPPLSRLARNFLDESVALAEITDSEALLAVLYRFSVLSRAYFLQADNCPPICTYARLINATVLWRTEKDGQYMADALRALGATILAQCNLIGVSALNILGCEDVPPLPQLPYRCYRRGTVYMIREIIQLYGKRLSCVLVEALLDLYSSKSEIDNMIAATFLAALSPDVGSIINMHNQNLILETIYPPEATNVSVCCCTRRYARYQEVCSANNITGNINIETVIDNVYLFDECATEPSSHTTCEP